jgi:hypothetical protein
MKLISPHSFPGFMPTALAQDVDPRKRQSDAPPRLPTRRVARITLQVNYFVQPEDN